jgi:hypothetical protein
MNASLNVDDISTTDLISGLLLRFGPKKFSEQSLYRFLRNLASSSSLLNERLRIVGPDDHLASEPVRRIISFLEMGKILEVAMPNPVDQYFRPRASQLESLRSQLSEEGILEKHDNLFRELAAEFEASLKCAKE